MWDYRWVDRMGDCKVALLAAMWGYQMAERLVANVVASLAVKLVVWWVDLWGGQ